MILRQLSSEERRPFTVLVASMACAVGSLEIGCAHHQATPPASAPAAPMVSETQTSPATTTTSSGTIQVADRLAKACGLDFNSVEHAPKFDFDKSVLVPDDRAVLDEVAKCVTVGPLKGRHLHLIGRADPRGEVEYNMVLGESRADSVVNYLTALGVAKARVDETSRGKLDATGTNEDGWRKDRGVDLDLL